jgi:hypothetical protein
MTKVRFHPIVEWFTGKMGKLVFRRSHNGQVSVYETPYMEGIKWSPAQKDHRQRLGEAAKYASAADADPDIRPLYVQMALEQGRNPKRPFDTAVSDYFHHGNDLLWKKHMGNQEKPQNWNMYYYAWYFPTKAKRRKQTGRWRTA